MEKAEKARNTAVWKAPLEPREGLHSVEMPRGARRLSAALQPAGPSVWFLVDPEEPEAEVRRFLMIGTGAVVSADEGALEFVATLLVGPAAVTHLFEVLA